MEFEGLFENAEFSIVEKESLSDVNFSDEYSLDSPERPKCSSCKKNVSERRSSKMACGSIKYYWLKLCTTCRRKKYDLPDFGSKRQKYRRIIPDKGFNCYKCGFIAQDKCQLDVDHINGNHNDNRIENLQILCANCHRLKTKLNKDNIK